MKKLFKTRTKVEVSIILILLVAVSASAITIKIGNDGTDTWSGGDQELITNSNGKAWEVSWDNLQDAVYDLNGTGGTVFVPVCNISFSKSLTISENNIKLVGSGKSIFWLTANSDCDVISVTGHNTTIKDIILIGNSENQGAGDWDGIELQDVSNCLIENVNVSDVNGSGSGSSSGIHFNHSCSFNTVRDSRVFWCRKGILLHTGNNTYNTIENCYVRDIIHEGIVVKNGYENNIVNCKMVRTGVANDGQALKIGNFAHFTKAIGNVISEPGFGAITLYDSNYCILDGNSIFGSGTVNAINVIIKNKERTCNYNVISNNNIHGAWNTGIGITNATDTDHLSYNVVSDNNIYGSTSYGVYLNNQGNNTVTGNMIYNVGSNGIHLSNNADHNHISGNFIHSPGNDGVYLLSDADNNVIVDNFVIAPGNTYIDDQDGWVDNVAINNINNDADDNVYKYINGIYYFYIDGEQTFSIERNNANYMSLRGPPDAADDLLLYASSGGTYPYIRMWGESDITFYSGRDIVFDEDGTDYMKMVYTAPYSIINGTKGHVTIDDVLRLEPISTPPSNPVGGMIYSDSDNGCIYHYNSSSSNWDQLN